MSTFYLSNQLQSNVSKSDLLKLIIKQVEIFFILSAFEKVLIEENIDSVLTSLEKNILGVKNKYYSVDNKPFFNPYHSVQYLTFLYYLSYRISAQEETHNEGLADKLYYLNKVLNSIDIYHKVQLPEVFFFEHPLGSVLGRASYGKNFFMMQGCTVGGTNAGYPILGENFSMYSNAKIIGNCKVGENVILAANCYVKDKNIEPNTIVFGQYPNLIFKENNSLNTNFNYY